tara:strand:- start:581 stop:1018 length:438 start_codon:yes stop_codon:yes gene_type:complete
MNRCSWPGKSQRYDKPWGHEHAWTGIFHGKEIHIKSGHRTSLKYNKTKDEVLYVQSGIVHVEYADEGHLTSPSKFPARSKKLKKGELLNVQSGCPYRLSALEDSIVFEISESRFGGGRVVIEDDYGRDCSEAEAKNLIFNPAKKA